MAFTVRYQYEPLKDTKDAFGDEGIYEFLEGGVLKVVSPDTNGQTSYTPPNVWLSVFADKDHKPGRPKRGKTAAPRTAAVSDVDTSRAW